MKKAVDFINVIIPFIIAIAIQALVVMLYELVVLIRYFISNGTDLNAIANGFVENMEAAHQLAMSIFIASLCLVIFGIWYNKLNRNGMVRQAGKIFSIKLVISILFLGIGAQISLSLMLNIMISIRPEWFRSYGQVMDQLGGGNSLLSVIYIGLIAPFSEEFIFRGIILKKAQKVMPFMGANIMQAMLFGIYHGNVVQGIYAFALGMLLGFICYRLSLFVAVLLHMVINISGILLGYIDTDKLIDPQGFWIILAVTGIGFFIIGTILLLKNTITSINE